MRAITVSEPGGPEVMAWTEVPDPTPGRGEVLVRVAATAVNRADLLQRKGFYPPPAGTTDTIGLECSGTVAAVGDGVTEWTVGDKVCGLLAGGGYAELVIVPAEQLMPIPEGIDLVTAAALPEVSCTVWSNVMRAARLTEGETLLIHGGGSGIGTHAIQIGKAFGARVAVTAGSDERVRQCLDLGADIAVNYRTEEFENKINADVILDNMGAKYLARNIATLNRGGRLMIIGMQGGAAAELNIGALLAKNAWVTATSLRYRPVSEKGEIIRDVVENVWPLIAAGKVRPVVHEVLPIQQVGDAHRHLDEG
ncbi:MAG TPA: NAD(P)H-quinone oxidoreductase, partial [Actinokineospora sp.]|nr:NAD(P)H-quinone oxidoreductase [Actinokineospora sp.]